jgi:hypothetical protein|tara:strand:- start:332 stop:451 length:120 start_codon:yes stop_codon:yes gene_type:complete
MPDHDAFRYSCRRAQADPAIGARIDNRSLEALEFGWSIA